jgi:ubiquinone/menaquinone biosynthesis C-methylase UbiE
MIADEQTRQAWEASYGRRENYVFSPCDALVRFVSRYLRRRVGLDETVDVLPNAAGSRVVDVGCGIGRNLAFGTQMGLQMHGSDLSTEAVAVARQWLGRLVGPVADSRVVQADVRSLPWSDGSFAHAISDSVLDSMSFATAQQGVAQIARLVQPGGYFYCSLISGDESGRARQFAGEVIVDTEHERGTVQSYFNYEKVRRLLEAHFEILSCELYEVKDVLHETHQGRWHVIARRR